MMKFAKPSALVLGVAMLASQAEAGRYGTLTLNSHQVNPLPNGSFEILEEAWDGPREFWCIASLHARIRLGAPNKTRIYVTSPYGPSQTSPGRRGVGFTITPSADLKAKGDLIGGISETVSQVGKNMSVGHTEQFCFRDLDF